MSAENIFFEQALKKEILKSERVRAKLIAGFSLFLAIVFSIAVFLFKPVLVDFLPSITPFYYFILVFLFLFARELAGIKLIDKAIRDEANISEFVRYVSVIIETSIPTLLLLILGTEFEKSTALLTPVVLLYTLFIILSTLTLDFKISVLSGLTASIGYSIIAISWTESLFAENISVFEKPVLYLGKAMLLLLGGVLAGFVGSQLRKRIYNTYSALRERNRVTDLFNQQVSQEIVDELVKGSGDLSPQRKFVCVMFLDIRGFTPFAEQREPEEIIKFQNEIFGFMINIITKNHGVINQFLGDGYMATFGAPVSRGNDTLNAYNAAVEIIKQVHRRNNIGKLPGTRIGIGLHSGDVVAGNVGTSTRKQYSISGNTVILAARIEQLNKAYGTELLVSKEVTDKIGNVYEVLKPLGEVKIKGREKPVSLFEVTNL
ncbi:MAG: guanylate cyclase [Melioribacteraceae bacterium]|nr:MAG: guanylate cyclase [Melioribacteraceae bacterium]